MTFGSFELDELNGELRRDGAPVKLAPRQFRLLYLLARNAGRVVTRDEIQREIWGVDTFVDFQRNLNVCVAQLRAALEDDSESPRFIETAPRRGYRFVAEITVPTLQQPAPLIPAARNAIQTTRQIGAWIAAFACCVIGTYLVVRPVAGFEPISGYGQRRVIKPVRVAVLPFESEGLTSELNSAIGSSGGERLAVIGRTSVMRFANKRPDAARELKAEYVVDGTTERQGNRVRIIASLVRTSDQVQVWGETVEGDATDILGLQQRLAGRVAAGMLRSVFGDVSAPVLPNPGAAAFAAVAEQHVGMARSGRGPSGVEFESAKAAAESALNLDPHDAVAHNALANALFWHDWNWNAAGREFSAAIDANPSLATAHHDLAFFLVATGRREEGLQALQRAMALDPFSVRVNIDAGWLLLQAHKFDDAIAQVRRTQELDPGNREAEACMARATLYQGRQPVGATDASDLFLHAAFSALRGQSSEALDSLDHAYEARSPMMVFLQTEPAFDKLRDEPRFRNLVTKMRFP